MIKKLDQLEWPNFLFGLGRIFGNQPFGLVEGSLLYFFFFFWLDQPEQPENRVII